MSPVKLPPPWSLSIGILYPSPPQGDQLSSAVGKRRIRPLIIDSLAHPANSHPALVRVTIRILFRSRHAGILRFFGSCHRLRASSYNCRFSSRRVYILKDFLSVLGSPRLRVVRLLRKGLALFLPLSFSLLLLLAKDPYLSADLDAIIFFFFGVNTFSGCAMYVAEDSAPSRSSPFPYSFHAS